MKNSGKVLEEQKRATFEALKEIRQCRKFHSKTLKIGYNERLEVLPAILLPCCCGLSSLTSPVIHF
jgi:hypothetical protein